jgi:hypothetical protein
MALLGTQPPSPAKYAPHDTSSMSTTNTYGQSTQQVQQQPHYGHTNTSTHAGRYNAPNSLTQPPHLRQHQQPPGGWNDAPVTLPPPTRVPAALPLNKPPAITSLFPNAAASPGYSPQPSPYLSPGSATLPPPRPGSVTHGQAPLAQGPPPVSRLPPQGPSGSFPVRPPSQAAGHSQLCSCASFSYAITPTKPSVLTFTRTYASPVCTSTSTRTCFGRDSATWSWSIPTSSFGSTLWARCFSASSKLWIWSYRVVWGSSFNKNNQALMVSLKEYSSNNVQVLLNLCRLLIKAGLRHQAALAEQRLEVLLL